MSKHFPKVQLYSSPLPSSINWIWPWTAQCNRLKDTFVFVCHCVSAEYCASAQRSEISDVRGRRSVTSCSINPKQSDSVPFLRLYRESPHKTSRWRTRFQGRILLALCVLFRDLRLSTPLRNKEGREGPTPYSLLRNNKRKVCFFTWQERSVFF